MSQGIFEMTYVSKIPLLLAGLALAACTNPSEIEGDNTVDFSSAAEVVDPLAIDPTSPDYFRDTIGDRILFKVDESTLNPEARSLLTRQAKWLTDNASYSVLIEGHADEQGTREYNLGLGARRASAVQQFLISQGVAPGRLRTVTFGKERPIEVCSEEACYAQNRRAVTILGAGSS